MEPALAASPADGGGGVPGVPTLPVPGRELPAPLAGGGGVPGVPMEPAPAALPADGGVAYPVPTLPVADCPPLAPACEATPVPSRAVAACGSSHGARVIDACGRACVVTHDCCFPFSAGTAWLAGCFGSYGVALSSTLLGVGKAPASA